MSYEEEKHAAAIRALPVLPRTLFKLHSFHDVDIATMADRLSTREADILACLAEARAMIHGHYPDAPKPRFDPNGIGLPIAGLEQRMREDYREHLQAAFIEAGYSGLVPWCDLPSVIEADEEQAAIFVLSYLRAPLRKAVSCISRPRVSMGDLWRTVPVWCRTVRRHLLDVAKVAPPDVV